MQWDISGTPGQYGWQLNDNGDNDKGDDNNNDDDKRTVDDNEVTEQAQDSEDGEGEETKIKKDDTDDCDEDVHDDTSDDKDKENTIRSGECKKCAISNSGFLLGWFGLVRFYQLFGLRVFCCVLFIRN